MARWAEWERGPSEQKHKSDRVRVRSSCCTSAWSQGQPAAAMLSTKATQLLIAALLKVTIQAQKLCRAAPATAVPGVHPRQHLAMASLQATAYSAFSTWLVPQSFPCCIAVVSNSLPVLCAVVSSHRSDIIQQLQQMNCCRQMQDFKCIPSSSFHMTS